MKVATSILVVLLCSSLQGCAYLTTYKSDLGSPAAGVSIDAKQRVVLITQENGINKYCAEPSPDALAALGASLGASVLSNSGATKQLSAALGEQAASIGLRTTSIQLMRDSMYRNCEAHLNRALDSKEYASLTAHSQNLIVGLLAIEQLTGAVAAHQVSLSTSSEAGSGEKADEEQVQLTAAQKEVIAQKRRVADAETTVKNLKVKSSEADSAVEAAKDSTDEESKELKAKADSAREELTIAQNALIEEQANLTVSIAAQKMAQDAYNLAASRVKAKTSGRSKFTETSQGGMTDEATEVVAQSVVNIVDKILGVGTKFQKCFDALLTTKDIPADNFAVLRDLCTAVSTKIKEQAEIEKKFDEQRLNNLKMRQTK